MDKNLEGGNFWLNRRGKKAHKDKSYLAMVGKPSVKDAIVAVCIIDSALSKG